MRLRMRKSAASPPDRWRSSKAQVSAARSVALPRTRKL